MGKIFKAADIALRYGVSEKTARRYMKSMRHQVKPLRVRFEDVCAWDKARERKPVDYLKVIESASQNMDTLLLRQAKERWIKNENRKAGTRER